MRRRTKILLFLILFLIGGFFCGENCQAKEANILINEVQISGGNGKASEDYVELYNKSSHSIKIGGWKIRKRVQSGTESSIKVFSDSAVIPAKSYFLWSNSSIKDEIKSDESTASTISANNSIAFLNNTGEIIDQVAWGNGHTNPFIETEALTIPSGQPERIGRKNFQDTDNNQEDFAILSVGSPTPSGCLENPEKCLIEDEKAKNLSEDIFINELLPAPGKENEEYIELYNNGEELLNLAGWELRDDSKTGKYIFGSENIAAKKYLIIYKTTYKFALNNSGDEKVFLLDPNGKEISSVTYTGSKENVSYNFNGKTWHWSKFLTPGKENIFNNEPYGTVKIDKAIFVNVSADFFVSTDDADGEEIKVTWDFGDGHKSYKQKTTHRYAAKGTYTGTVKLSDASTDVVKNFTIEVKKYPTPKVEIVKIKANPKGKDTEGEEIYLKNNSKKKINLKTWSIATGSKALYNHPITKDFVIKPGKTKKITRKYSLFTLNNKKGVIELRYPNGEVASHIKYNKKKETVKDDEVYELSGKKWQWNSPAEEVLVENVLQDNPMASLENLEDLFLKTEPEITKEEVTLNLGRYSSENKLALIEAGFGLASKNILQSREIPGIVLGAFSAHNEIRQPIEIKPTNFWQKTLQKSNWFLNFLINRIIVLI